jgi:general secretion pathway protein C
MSTAAALGDFRRHSPWLARAALAAAVLLVLLAAVRLLWLLLAGPVLPAPELPAGVREADSGTAVPQAAGSVARWHLFGSSESLPEAVASAPETDLRLFLRGTLNESVPEQGIAIVGDEHGVDRAYRVGDLLPGDARLVAVHAGRILIERGGRREGLSLRSDLESPRRSGGGAGAAPADTRRSTTAPYPELQPFALPAMNFGVPNLEGLRERLPDAAELARQVGVQPVLENQRMVGVRLTVGRDSDLLERYGLRASDIVTAVNGIPLDGPARQAELLSSLREGQPVTLTIRRDGATQELTLRR